MKGDCMKGAIVNRYNNPSSWFVGVKEGFASSTEIDSIGEGDEWVELTLYQTQGGGYVCYRVYRSNTPDKREVIDDLSCNTMAEVVEFFGHSDVAKKLYEKCGIDSGDK